jgi:hypothetical protein
MLQEEIACQLRSELLRLLSKITALSRNQLKMNDKENSIAPSPDRPDRDDTQYCE